MCLCTVLPPRQPWQLTAIRIHAPAPDRAPLPSPSTQRPPSPGPVAPSQTLKAKPTKRLVLPRSPAVQRSPEEERAALGGAAAGPYCVLRTFSRTLRCARRPLPAARRPRLWNVPVLMRMRLTFAALVAVSSPHTE